MLVKIFALCALNRLRSKINCIHRPAQGRRSVLFACLPQTNSRFNAWSMLIGLKLAAPFRTCKRTKILKKFRIDVGLSFIDLQIGGCFDTSLFCESFQKFLMFFLKFVGMLPRILILSWSLFSFVAKREYYVYFCSLQVCWYWFGYIIEWRLAFILFLFCFANFLSWCFSPISVCLLGWFRLFGIRQQYTGGVNLSISSFFWWIIGLKIICNGMQCEKFVSVPVVAVLLGTVHILRKIYFYAYWTPFPPT